MQNVERERARVDLSERLSPYRHLDRSTKVRHLQGNSLCSRYCCGWSLRVLVESRNSQRTSQCRSGALFETLNNAAKFEQD